MQIYEMETMEWGGGDFTSKKKKNKTHMLLTLLDFPVLWTDHLLDGWHYSLGRRRVRCQESPILLCRRGCRDGTIVNHATCYHKLVGLLHEQDVVPHRRTRLLLLFSPIKQTPHSQRPNL